MSKIILTGWKVGMKKVSLSRLLRDHAGLTLSEAKGCVDSILKEEPVTIQVACYEQAQRILTAALALGAVGELRRC